LFNLAADLGEKQNLAAARPKIVKDLAARYEAHAGQATPPKSRPKPPDFFDSAKIKGNIDWLAKGPLFATVRSQRGWTLGDRPLVFAPEVTIGRIDNRRNRAGPR
jgi:hypothetical protein